MKPFGGGEGELLFDQVGFEKIVFGEDTPVIGYIFIFSYRGDAGEWDVSQSAEA